MKQAECEELFSWLRLVLTPGIGPKRARKLLATFGSAPAIFEQSYQTLIQLVTQNQARSITVEPDHFEQQCQELQTWLNASTLHRVIPLGHDNYPSKLLETADPPLLLYASGRLELLNKPSIAMVGSRRPTPQGQETATDFARTLARQGITIVSGLALGIDGASQEAAVGELGSTIAVLGTGIDRVYPASHHALAHAVAKQGLLISEYPLGTPPTAHNFPKRNRIIAGLALGTLVVEATLHSGSLITARVAAEIGRDVFAIPGSIHSPQAKGCHWLIKQGAKLVEAAQDVIEELQLPIAPPTISTPPEIEESLLESTSSDENEILKAIGAGPTSFEAIGARTGIDTATLQVMLLTLELDQKIARLPGNLFQSIHKNKS